MMTAQLTAFDRPSGTAGGPGELRMR